MIMYEIMYLYQVGVVQKMGRKRKYEGPIGSKNIICLMKLSQFHSLFCAINICEEIECHINCSGNCSIL